MRRITLDEGAFRDLLSGRVVKARWQGQEIPIALAIAGEWKRLLQAIIDAARERGVEVWLDPPAHDPSDEDPEV